MSLRDLWAVEQAFWTDDAEQALAHVDAAAVMIFADAGILDRPAIAKGLRDAPRWQSVSMTNQTTVEAGNTVVLAYRADARREGQSYRALCSSIWVRQGEGWCLLAHQQTAV
ncbi:MAG: nuclear transport factor 2 family protein [Paracoccus sp. (in: a-proteobacteria)]|uniref:nuclear transport factor 2 family protein n=1 Tax=Paracoccus sp. TaxID=267 RepID=UPI0026E03430|nr:nuclear transport factor 2 family protein [Paracoccus sp. (in: a-proteobacteria)]MDO5632685.1 nuclear transport factor 2 family protein [Paracoccus sp. (in: a-proteobacteria)]